jgi:hypothetical protein
MQVREELGTYRSQRAYEGSGPWVIKISADTDLGMHESRVAFLRDPIYVDVGHKLLKHWTLTSDIGKEYLHQSIISPMAQFFHAQTII